MNQRPATPRWTVPAPGESIAGKYRVEGTCGRGSSAVVLFAADAEGAERVVIKVLLPDFEGDAEAVERFMSEARAAERIESEHVARVLDIGTLDSGAPYVVYERLEGDSLKEVLAKWQPLPVATAVDWLVQACEAVGEAHVNGLVHGDLKPSNLVLAPCLRPGGVVSIKVIDFGLSKPTDVPTAIAGQRLTGAADVTGSPHYMAPEQLRASRETNPRTDIWALGAVLCEVLTGEPPFAGDTLPQVCAAVLTEPPRDLRSLRSDLPRGLELCIVRCLEKDPAARFARALDLSRALAPFGSPIARASLARLERVCSAARPAGRSSPLQQTPSTSEGEAPLPDLPSEVYAVPRRGGASAPVIFGSLFMLTALGAGAFLAMYGSVHGGTSARAEAPLGLTAGQATAGIVEISSSSPLPVVPTPPDPLATTSPFAVVPNAPSAPAAPPALPDVSVEAPADGTPPSTAAVSATAGVSHVQHSPLPARAPIRRAVVQSASRPAPPPPSGGAPVSAQPRGNGSSAVMPDGVPAATGGEPGNEPAKTDSNPYEQPQEAPASQAQAPVADPFDNRK